MNRPLVKYKTLSGDRLRWIAGHLRVFNGIAGRLRDSLDTIGPDHAKLALDKLLGVTPMEVFPDGASAVEELLVLRERLRRLEGAAQTVAGSPEVPPWIAELAAEALKPVKQGCDD